MGRKLIFEVVDRQGNIYRPPQCRLKIDQEGGIGIYVKTERNKWRGMKGIVRIEGIEIWRAEKKYRRELRKVPRLIRWLFKINYNEEKEG